MTIRNFSLRCVIILTAFTAFLLGNSSSDVYGYSSTVTIQPIQVSDGINFGNAGQELFPDETQKIWNQADIQIIFDPWVRFIDATYWDLDLSPGSTEFFDLSHTDGHRQSSDLLTINMWFVHSIFDTSIGGMFFGVSDGGIAIAISDVTFRAYRIDTLAHEIGHSLGLLHTSTNTDLMAPGSIRQVPDSIKDIHPDGADLDNLSTFEIQTAQRSPYSVTIPEPCTLMLFSLGITALFGLRRCFKV
jgi:hypothetical protein